MDFLSSEKLSYEEPSPTPIPRQPSCYVPMITDKLIAKLNPNQPPNSPSPTSSPKPSGSKPNPETQPHPETQTDLNITIMPESIVEEVITLFPHDTNIAYDIRPLSSLPQHPETQQPTLELIIPSRPTILTQPRTTTSAPSSPKVIPK